MRTAFVARHLPYSRIYRRDQRSVKTAFNGKHLPNVSRTATGRVVHTCVSIYLKRGGEATAFSCTVQHPQLTPHPIKRRERERNAHANTSRLAELYLHSYCTINTHKRDAAKVRVARVYSVHVPSSVYKSVGCLGVGWAGRVCKARVMEEALLCRDLGTLLLFAHGSFVPKYLATSGKLK